MEIAGLLFVICAFGIIFYLTVSSCGLKGALWVWLFAISITAMLVIGLILMCSKEHFN